MRILLKNFKIEINTTAEQKMKINKTITVKKVEKQLCREQRYLSHKYKNFKKGGATQRRNIQKQKLKVQEIYHSINSY